MKKRSMRLVVASLVLVLIIVTLLVVRQIELSGGVVGDGPDNFAPNTIVLANGLSQYTFSTDSLTWGLESMEDLTTGYVFSFKGNNPAWRAEFWKHATPVSLLPVDSTQSGITTSYSLSTLPDGTQVLTLVWNAMVENDPFSVTETWTLKPNDSVARMRISLDGSLNSHSVNYLGPVMSYDNIPLDSKAIVPFREFYFVNNPQSLSGFTGLWNSQYGNLYSIYPPNSNSYIYFAIEDSKGYFRYAAPKGDNGNYELKFAIIGDKQLLPNQGFSPDLEFAIGPATGKYPQDWLDSEKRYKSWLEQQTYFPEKLYDRTDIPEYLKQLKYFDFVTPGSIDVPVLTAPHAAYDISDSVAPLFGYGNYVSSPNMWGMTPELSNILTTLKNDGVHTTAFVGSSYIALNDPSYINNPQLADSRLLDIDGNAVQGGSPPAAGMHPISPAWQNFQYDSYIDIIPSGLEGYYMDAPLFSADYGHGFHGGGSHNTEGMQQLFSFMRQARSFNPDMIIWTEAAWEYYQKDTDFIATTGASMKLAQSEFFDESERKDFVYIPIMEYLYSGLQVIAGAPDRPLQWGIDTADSAIKAEAYALTMGRTITDRPEPLAKLYLNPPNGGVTIRQFGYMLDFNTWTTDSTPIYAEVSLFRAGEMAKLDDYFKFTRFGELMRIPSTNSQIVEETYYELPQFNTKVDFPEVPVSVWKALDGSLGIVAINTLHSSNAITINIPFQDYGLTEGADYNLYKKDGNTVILIGTYTTDFSLNAQLTDYEPALYELIKTSDDPDSDGEAAQRYDTNAPWDNCPVQYNPNQLDSDKDGFGNICDCRPTDAGAYPGATEVCNNIDDDCDNVIDESCQFTAPLTPSGLSATRS